MAAVKASNVLALLNLAWRTLVHFATYPFRARSTYAQVMEAYQMRPLLPPPAALACIGCGQCERLLPEAPSLILRLGRQAGDAPYSTAACDQLDPVAAAITAMCPYGVDVPALLRFARR